VSTTLIELEPEMLVFVEEGKPENPEKKTLEARSEPTKLAPHV